METQHQWLECRGTLPWNRVGNYAFVLDQCVYVFDILGLVPSGPMATG